MVSFFPPRCCDCGALPGKEHQSWCPDFDPGFLHDSSFELEPQPEQQLREVSDDAATSRVSSVVIDRETLDLEALRPFFTNDALRDAVTI